MTRDEVLAELAEARQALLDAIEGLPEDDLTEPGVVGEWSVADVLAHLVGWQAAARDGVTAVLAGRPRPAPPIFSSADLDRYNADLVAARAEQSVPERLADLAAGQQAIVDRLAALDAAMWERLGPQLVQALANDTYDHEREHAAQIRAWRAARDNDASGRA